MVVLFFFSSRRRHTRFDCDWSSDVCSSDLNFGKRGRGIELREGMVLAIEPMLCDIGTKLRRSEERRVGKSVDLGGRRIIKKKKKKKKITSMNIIDTDSTIWISADTM